MHGTYDHKGTFHVQTVRLGQTQSGRPGLFTHGTLAWPLSPEEYAALRDMPARELRAYCNARGFELEV